MNDIQSGDLNRDIPPEKRGWFIGRFMDNNFHSDDFEMKWTNAKKGEILSKLPKKNKIAKSLAILISGKCTYKFFEQNKIVVLSQAGQYVFWNNEIFHEVIVDEDSVILSIRWPSLKDDQVELQVN